MWEVRGVCGGDEYVVESMPEWCGTGSAQSEGDGFIVESMPE